MIQRLWTPDQCESRKGLGIRQECPCLWIHIINGILICEYVSDDRIKQEDRPVNSEKVKK